MNRRALLQSLLGLAALPLLPAAVRAAGSITTPIRSVIVPLRKPLSAWRALLPPAAYQVLFEQGTERPFSSPLLKETRAGTFVCAACFLPLFSSAQKYDSGTGWPSFTQPIPGSTGTQADYKLIEKRIEYHCARCGGHQGHVFNDGPPPRGERWCNNGIALNFIPRGRPLPALRT